MFRTKKVSKEIDLSKVKTLNLVYEGRLSIYGKNCRLELGYNHVEFTTIKFSMEDANFSKMSVSSVVEGYTDNEVIIRIKAIQESRGQEQDTSDISDFERYFGSQQADLRKIDRLHPISDGKILIDGDNTRLLLGFQEGDFVFVKFTIDDTSLNKMSVSDIMNNSIFIDVQGPDDW